MDHRRGCPRPCPSRARAQRHDPGRPRHLSGRPAQARRPPAGPGAMVAAPRAADPRRGGRRLGNRLHSPQDVSRLHDVNDLLVEGGSATATAFLAADLVDRMLIYRAPILVGEGKSSVGYIGLDAIADAHGRWRLSDGAPAWHRPARSLRARSRLRQAATACSPASSPTSAPSAASSSAATCA